MATTVGSGSYQYELNESWARLPAGWAWGQVSAVATDSQDRVYAFQRKDPPVVVFDRDGNYLTSWGHSAINGADRIVCGTDGTEFGCEWTTRALKEAEIGEQAREKILHGNAAALLSPLASIARREPAAA